jgi:hypothetical protein
VIDRRVRLAQRRKRAPEATEQHPRGEGGLAVEAVLRKSESPSSTRAAEAVGADHGILAVQVAEDVARKMTRCGSCCRAACNWRGRAWRGARLMQAKFLLFFERGFHYRPGSAARPPKKHGPGPRGLRAHTASTHPQLVRPPHAGALVAGVPVPVGATQVAAVPRCQITSTKKRKKTFSKQRLSTSCRRTWGPSTSNP